MLEKWISSLFLHAEESKREKERNQKKKREKQQAKLAGNIGYASIDSHCL